MHRTKSGLPKHCTWHRDRHGKRRLRFRKGTVSAYLPGIPWGEEFMRAYAAALERTVARTTLPIGAAHTVPSSFDALAVTYYASASFQNLRASTQAARRAIIEAFRREHGAKPLKELTRGHIIAILGARRHTPEAANNLLKVLRVLLAFAYNIGLVGQNPAAGVKGYKRQGDGFPTWREDEVERFKRRHPPGTMARLALELLLGTAQRRGDVVKLGWQNVRGDAIAVRQEKTGAALLVPMHPDLLAELKLLPRTQLTLLTMANGAPFSAKAFRLAHAGASASEIAAVTGHRSLAEVAHYTRAADQVRLARAARSRQTQAERIGADGLPNLDPALPNLEKKQ
jgi:integrase